MGDLNLPSKLQATPSDCVVNRGVVLIDTKAWRRQKMTELIETLVHAHLSDKGPLWRSGVSQPPFLLAIAGRYANLGWRYNVRGLGRNEMSVRDLKYMKEHRMWPKSFDKFLFVCKFGNFKNIAFCPGVNPRAHESKILHYNGRLKPHKRRSSDAPLGVPLRNMTDEHRRKFEKRTLCSCGPECMTECGGIWWRYYGGPRIVIPTSTTTTAAPNAE